MITFLKGQLVEKTPTRCVLDVGGVGYEVLIPLSSYDRLPAVNEDCRILVHDYVREDQHMLFGFMSEPERGMFLLLLGASGIGPKLALSALSGLTVRELKAAVAERDVKRISSISGIGKKMAERIVVELGHKIGAAEALEAMSGAEDREAGDLRLRDAVLALVALGYKQDVARKKTQSVLADAGTEGLDVEGIIKRVLSR